jgi:micrococcal nuclease
MYSYAAKIVRWVDGDTLIVDIDLGFRVTRQERLRLARINTPELNSAVPFQVRKAKNARAVAKKFAPEGVWVNIKTGKSKIDRYARYIAEVEYNGVNVSDYLLEQEVAKELKM